MILAQEAPLHNRKRRPDIREKFRLPIRIVLCYTVKKVGVSAWEEMMTVEKGKKRFSIRNKMYIFVILTVLSVALGTSAIAFNASADQIDRYYKQNTADNARNFASMVDGDFLAELRRTAETDEFQALRDRAEEEENEAPIEEFLREKGLWEKYSATRDQITEYLGNMSGIKYLYIIAHGDENADHDMYLVDDAENPIYETGYYEEREAELLGMDVTNLPEPTISHGDWGWLCTDFKPVYTSDGKCVCIVGCDIGMDEVMAERRNLLYLLAAGTIILTSVILTAAVLFINRAVVKPLRTMTEEMKKFTPSEKLSYKEAGVMDIDIRSNDEIGEIYEGIRNLEINTIDYLHDMAVLQEENRKAENDLRDKEEQIDQLSIESSTDALTGVGNKTAYIRKTDELNTQMNDPSLEFAMVMVDMNNLKQINDEHGHRAGDLYIQGCCRMVCETFKHSPVYRIGGDEFVAILQGTDYKGRKAACERLRAAFEKSCGQKDASPWLRYSAAVGMAERAADDNTAEFVFRRADKAMYLDKERFKKEHGIETR